MLPTLPSELAVFALQEIAQGLKNQAEPDRETLLKITDRVRYVIQHRLSIGAASAAPTGKWEADAPYVAETRLELALDVCLFARKSFQKVNRAGRESR
jgi:hypothetical protein